jgi:hypothetical protein
MHGQGHTATWRKIPCELAATGATAACLGHALTCNVWPAKYKSHSLTESLFSMDDPAPPFCHGIEGGARCFSLRVSEQEYHVLKS